MLRQDLVVVGILLLVYGALYHQSAAEPVVSGAHTSRARPMPRSLERRVGVLAVALVLVGIAGHYTVMWSYAFSRDEQMVLFDAAVFRSGHFVARLPEEWAPYHAALNMLFIPRGMEGTGWISLYSPVNAALHALGGMAGTPALTNPLLAAAGLVATWQVARRVLPDDSESQWVAVLLYACSTQVMANAMTTYAMTGHLALNMIWLALLLHDRWYSHIGALVIGVLAIGLHQVVYHPLFAGPFLFFLLVLRRRWGLSLAYAVVYAAAIVLWTKFSWFAWHELAAGPGVPRERSPWDRLVWTLAAISPEYLWLKCAYLIRFVTWEHVLLLPLFAAGMAPIVRSRDPRLLGMIAAIAVLIVAKTILRPYQGHGWGYRYMHGVIGIVCIVAAVGWRKLRDEGAIEPKHLKYATAVSLLVVSPWLLYQSHAFAGAYARVDRQIAATDADMVVIDDTVPAFNLDLVYNPPYVDARPVRLAASKLDEGDISALCQRGSMAFVDSRVLAPIAAIFGQAPVAASGTASPLRDAAVRASCAIRPLGHDAID